MLRAAGRCARGALQAVEATSGPGLRDQVPCTMATASVPRLSSRTFAADAHHGHGVTHAGLTLHKPAAWHTVVGTGMSALMWFWVFYRAYHDGDTLLYGHAAHFEHAEHEQSQH